jgi:hypothetical protein
LIGPKGKKAKMLPQVSAGFRRIPPVSEAAQVGDGHGILRKV